MKSLLAQLVPRGEEGAGKGRAAAARRTDGREEEIAVEIKRVTRGERASRRTIAAMKYALALLLLLAPIARGEVVESSASSLRVKYLLTVPASPEKAWQSFVNIAAWWSSDHTFSGNAANLRLDPRVNGCWCESLPNGGGVQHMTVVLVMPNQRMTLAGALGPLQTSGVAGAMTIQFVPKGAATEMSVTYNAGGFYPGGLASVAPVVDQVLGTQFARLGRWIETGSAEVKPAAK